MHPERYDPAQAPEPEGWLAADEGERIHLVEVFHRKAREPAPNPKLHAVVHVIVENQAAAGDELPVQETLTRLQAEGLDRHDAIHAVGSVLAFHMTELLKGAGAKGDPNEPYWEGLRRLTAESWRRGD